MPEKDYSRSVSMICPTCACSDFEYDEEIENAPIICAGCKRVFTRDELIAENGEIVDAHLEEMKDKVLSDFHKKFEDMMTKAFSGNSNIKFTRKLILGIRK